LHSTKKIVIFASGTGSNAKKIMQYFSERSDITVVYVLSNNSGASVLDAASEMNVPSDSFTRQDLYESDRILGLLKKIGPDLLVLAGFLWKIPAEIIAAFPNKIVNIHPALLPKYGGKGMYGHHVHRAVLANKEKQSGITIHYVNEQYDEGQTIAQFKTGVSVADNIDSLVQKIKKLEHKHFAKVIDNLLSEQ